MKKITSILVMLLLLSGALNAQDNSGNVIQIDINYPIKNDSTIDITSKIPEDIRDSIIAKRQPDFKEGDAILISINRDTSEKSIKLHLIKGTFNKLEDNQKAILCSGIKLDTGKKDSIMLKINLTIIGSNTSQGTIEEGRQTSTADGQSTPPSNPSTPTVDTIMESIEDTIFLNKKTTIIQYEIYAIGALALLSILISLFKHKPLSAEESEKWNEKLRNVQSKIQSLSANLLQLDNNKATSDDVKSIVNRINTIELELENIKTSIKAIQNPNKDSEQRSTRERGHIQGIDTNFSANKRIGYTTEPAINGLEEKKILPDSSDFCIYEIEFINEQKAQYYINRDPKALQNILSVAYMIPGDNNNQTNNQQATQVKTEEPGVLLKINGKWYTEKQLKFTIL